MKSWLFIIGLLVSALLFAPELMSPSEGEGVSPATEAIMEKQNTTDTQRKFEVLSNELKTSNCLTPRRVFQSSNNSVDLREWKTFEKFLQDLRLRGENQLHKVSQHTSTFQGVIVSTLFCRMGQYVYSLRKLII